MRVISKQKKKENEKKEKKKKKKELREERGLEESDMTQGLIEEKTLQIIPSLGKSYSTLDEFSRALKDVKRCLRCNERGIK